MHAHAFAFLGYPCSLIEHASKLLADLLWILFYKSSVARPPLGFGNTSLLDWHAYDILYNSFVHLHVRLHPQVHVSYTVCLKHLQNKV